MLVSTFVGLYLLISRDISKKELGASPFKVDDSIVEENNDEYLKLIEIGKKISGEEEYQEKYQYLDLYNTKNRIDLLLEYFQNNQINLDQDILELFKGLKFPKPNLEVSHPDGLHNIFNYYQKKIILEILLKNFDNAKKYFILMNQASEFLLNKTVSCVSGMVVISSKLLALSVVKEFINSPDFSIDQKLEILEILNGPIPSKFFKNIMYYEEELLLSNFLDLKKDQVKTQQYILFQAYTFQPNKSIKILRDTMVEKIALYDISTSTLRDMTEYDDTPYANLKFYSKNFLGKAILDIVLPIYMQIGRKMLEYKSYCNQFTVAKEILYFKKKNRFVPKIVRRFTSSKGSHH